MRREGGGGRRQLDPLMPSSLAGSVAHLASDDHRLPPPNLVVSIQTPGTIRLIFFLYVYFFPPLCDSPALIISLFFPLAALGCGD